GLGTTGGPDSAVAAAEAGVAGVARGTGRLSEALASGAMAECVGTRDNGPFTGATTLCLLAAA
ncbi:MAG TPA: hypothetical protein VF294_18825, partial [Polyangiaceae bacterium]